MAVNKVILVGNVGKDPETRHLDSGTTLCKFPLATNEVYKKDGEQVKNTEWHNIVLWRKIAEVAEQYVKKGDLLYIEGRIRTRSYDDQDGNKKYMTEIIGDNLQMLGKRQSDGDSAPNDSPPANNTSTNNDTETASDDFSSQTDDLPF